MLAEGTLSEDGLQVAFSREQKKRIYVQELLVKNRERVYGLLCKVRT